MPQHFTHLHLHTEYSLLDGAIGLDDLISFGKQHNFNALGISDHGNIFGAVKFFQKAHAAKIKPILGMEAYFTEDIAIKNPEKKYYHLMLIVENEVGYKNLCKLLEVAYTAGFYFKPRIDYALLKKHAEGLIVTSACLGGHIPQLLMNEQYDAAEERIDWFLNVFGPERFYLEVQPDDQEDQKILNRRIFEMSAKFQVPVVATGDCHYVHLEDRMAHEVMLAVQTRSKMTDPDRFTFGDCRAYMRTVDEMLTLFPNNPEVIWNSGVIADRCSFNFPKGNLYFPSYPLPEKSTAEEHFTELCVSGLNDLLSQGRIQQEKEALYRERLDEEIGLIIKMGFVTYFLVVSDFIRWAKKQNIPVGPGRGSAAGSLVAWAMSITDVDPIEYNLLFERFLNPERVSMPDIDIDFCVEGRDKVISYVRERYGHDHVCQIITFGTMMAKGVIKDVARALGLPFDDSQAITDLISDQLKITLTEAIAQEPRLKKLVETNPHIAELFKIALRLEGLTRHASKHAAGVVITPQPVSDMLPVYIPPKTDELVTQYAMTELESLGFLKMDFLGLKNLTLIQQVIDLIRDNHEISIDITRLPLDDALTFALLCRGGTSGVFQLESNGLKDVLRRLQPEKFEDIIAVNALYRPGPLNSGMVDDFIARRHGKQEIKYVFKELEPILAETYGVIVYQEQVMHIASAIAGFSLGEADLLRRAMGKKKADEMAKQKEIFVTRAVARSFDEKKASELFDLMAYFAGYGFNKSHSTAYALIAYQTAYLKAHYPAEFMACLISLETSDPETMAAYISEAKSMKIAIMPPHINRSLTRFTARNGTIIFGLQGIKNVGDAALSEILKQREKGPFTDLFDLCYRIDLRTVNKRVLESLISAGACDDLPGHRAQKCAALNTVMEQCAEKKREEATGQLSLFGNDPATAQQATRGAPLPDVEPWPIKTALEKEQEVLGLYLSGHPLDAYAPYVQAIMASPAAQDSGSVTRYGTVKSLKTIVTKKGDQMAFMALEDMNSTVEVILFPKVYRTVQPWLTQYSVFAVKGIVDGETAREKVKAQELIPLELVVSQGYGITECIIVLSATPTDVVLNTIKTYIVAGSTILRLQFPSDGRTVCVTAQTKITITPDLMQCIEQQQGSVQFVW